MDRPANSLSLSFTTEPAAFEAQTSVQFSVVELPETTAREHISFLVEGEGEEVEWEREEVVVEVVRELGKALDVDISRFQNVTLQEVQWVCGSGIMGYHSSNVSPSLPPSLSPSLPPFLSPSFPPSLPLFLSPSLPLSLPPSLPPSYSCYCPLFYSPHPSPPQRGETVTHIEFYLLDRHPSDPPDVASLTQSVDTLRGIVEGGTLEVREGGGREGGR